MLMLDEVFESPQNSFRSTRIWVMMMVGKLDNPIQLTKSLPSLELFDSTKGILIHLLFVLKASLLCC